MIAAAVAGYVAGRRLRARHDVRHHLCADNAKFGQPGDHAGRHPRGRRHAARLTRFVGKAKAMDMVLTGRMMDAAEAERSRPLSRGSCRRRRWSMKAVKMAAQIATMSRPSVLMAKETVNRAYETSLAEGVRFERRLFYSLFATEDQKEGMSAFIEKRKPNFKNR